MYVKHFILLVPLFLQAKALIVSKFKQIKVKESSWQQLAEVVTSANCFNCAYSANRLMGFLASSYDSSLQQCERAPPTCVRPGDGEAAKDVFMSSTTTEYLGCYLDSGGQRNLPTSKGLNIQDLTPDWCVYTCLNDGFPYAGVNEGKECWCGPERPRDSMTHPENLCYYACTGDASQSCGGGAMQQAYYTFKSEVPYWKISQSDRETWTLTGTDSESDAVYPIENIYDKEYHIANSYLTKFLMNPWLQIDMGSDQLVKSVKVAAAANEYVRASYLEVRVGDTEATATHLKNPDHNKMCHNKLCFTSGKYHGGGYLGAYVEDDCVTPLTGRYVTIQRYGFYVQGDTRLQLEEVNVVVYCEGSLPEDVCPEPTPDDCDTQLPLTHMGCFSIPNPVLVNYLNVIPNTTPLDCAKACKEADPTNVAIGLIHITHCYCGKDPITTNSDQTQNVCGYLCQGDNTQICGYGGGHSIYTIDSDTLPVETWLKTADDKANWIAYASSIKEGGSFMPSFSIDGTHSSTDTNIYMSDPEDSFPWLQIKMGSSLLVKRLKLQGLTQCCPYKALPHLEIRVGDTDVRDVAKPGKRICANRICHTTGSSQFPDTTFDCTVPRQGQYISIQRYRKWHSGVYGTEWGWQMAISEIDVDHLVS